MRSAFQPGRGELGKPPRKRTSRSTLVARRDVPPPIVQTFGAGNGNFWRLKDLSLELWLWESLVMDLAVKPLGSVTRLLVWNKP